MITRVHSNGLSFLRSAGAMASLLCGAGTIGCGGDMPASAELPLDVSTTKAALEGECSDLAVALDSVWLVAGVAPLPVPGLSMMTTIAQQLTAMTCGDGMESLVQRMEEVADQRIDAAMLRQLKNGVTTIQPSVAAASFASAPALRDDISKLESDAYTTGASAFEIQLSLAVSAANLGDMSLSGATGSQYSAERENLIRHLNLSQQRINELQTSQQLNLRLEAGTASRISVPPSRGNYTCTTPEKWCNKSHPGAYCGAYRAVGSYDDLNGAHYTVDEEFSNFDRQPALSAARARCEQFRQGYHWRYATQLAPIVRKIEETRQFLLAVANKNGILPREYFDPFVDQPLPASGIAMQQGRSFLGTGSLPELDTNDPESCTRRCLESASCTGGTFNPDIQKCYFQTGGGSTQVGSSDEQAFRVSSSQADSYFLSLMVQERAFWGTGVFRDYAVDSAADCYRTCLEDFACTGGTFNPDVGTCWLSTGSANLESAEQYGDAWNYYGFVLEGARRNAHYDQRAVTGLCSYDGTVLKTLLTFSAAECHALCSENANCAAAAYYKDDFYCVTMSNYGVLYECQAPNKMFFLR